MNRNRHLSKKTYGARHVQPHQPRSYATKKKKRVLGFLAKREKLARLRND